MAAPVPCRRLRRLLLREPRVHPGVDLAADLVQERLDYRVPVGRPELVVGFRSGADLLGRQRGTHADTIYRREAWDHRLPLALAVTWQRFRSAWPCPGVPSRTARADSRTRILAQAPGDGPGAPLLP